MTTLKTCTKGSDATCTTENAAYCCAYFKVKEENASPTTDQKTIIDAEALAGWPTKNGDEAYFCFDGAMLKAAIVNDVFNDPVDGIKYTAYCA